MRYVLPAVVLVLFLSYRAPCVRWFLFSDANHIWQSSPQPSVKDIEIREEGGRTNRLMLECRKKHFLFPPADRDMKILYELCRQWGQMLFLSPHSCPRTCDQLRVWTQPCACAWACNEHLWKYAYIRIISLLFRHNFLRKFLCLSSIYLRIIYIR